MKGRIRNNGMFNTQVINRNIVDDGLIKKDEKLVVVLMMPTREKMPFTSHQHRR